ncbi:enolase-phosphatase E1-like isoform X1 [Branchiostoma lanceolatum]|uniref:enolase-phosphatase E1-like isoform X1 n=2 Tax=Branchiostoma lanceolatum TaxID=7740 RepID=UPI0034514187
MGEWTIAVIDVEEALPPSLLPAVEAKPKPSSSVSEPAPEVPVSKPCDLNRTLPSSLLADAEPKPKPPSSASVPPPEVAEPTVWTVASKTESTVSEPRSLPDTPSPEPTPPSQPKKRYFSDLFAKLSSINTLGRSTQSKPAASEEPTQQNLPEPVVIDTVQETTMADESNPQLQMADDNNAQLQVADDKHVQLEVHPEPCLPVLDVKSTEVTTSDTEQDSGTYDGVENASVSSDDTTNSDLYTGSDLEDQPTKEPESAYEDVQVYEEVTVAAEEEAKTEETPTQQEDDKGTKEKKKKKTPGCTGNLFSCMKKPGSKKKKETTKKEVPKKDAEEPVEEKTEETEKEEKVDEGIAMKDDGYVTITNGEA